MIYRDIIEISTKTDNFYDITDKITKIVEESSIRDGLCNVFVKGTTAGLLINENDRMLIEDFRKLLSDLAPENRIYQHPENAHSHLRASILNNGMSIPVADGKLVIGTWQNVLLFEFDVRPREREVIITLYGN